MSPMSQVKQTNPQVKMALTTRQQQADIFLMQMCLDRHLNWMSLNVRLSVGFPVDVWGWPVYNEVVVEIFQTSEQLKNDTLHLNKRQNQILQSASHKLPQQGRTVQNDDWRPVKDTCSHDRKSQMDFHHWLQF